MSRRAGKGEIAFGSDSFLDIVANIVGILIILMVVAGVRVSQNSTVAQSVDEAETIASAPAPVAVAPPRFEPELLIPPRVAVPPEPGPIIAPEPPPRTEPSPDLLRIAADLRAEAAALETGTVRHAAELREVAAREQSLRGRLGEQADTLSVREKDAEQGQQRVKQLEGTLTEFTVQLRNLEAELAAAQQEQAPPATAIKHRMTPLSRTVEGDELHFQLVGNRISPIPVEALSERLKSQILRQKDWLLKFPKHQGVVGPIGGFSMAYVVERTEVASLGRFDEGVGVMRISVSEWVLKPEPDVPSESFEESLRPGSAFLQAVRLADAGATLTFWVYPDSFTLYRQLTEVCHREGFTVAARPLPFGVSIAASKNGTRSAAQ